MALELSLKYAANLASDVYDVKSVITREDFLEDYKSDMEITSAKLPSGVTGGYILKSWQSFLRAKPTTKARR